jgi:hypothetical protein
LQIVFRLQDALNEGVEGSVKAEDVDELNLVLFSKVKQFLIDFDFGHQVLVEQFELGQFCVDFVNSIFEKFDMGSELFNEFVVHFHLLF